AHVVALARYPSAQRAHWSSSVRLRLYPAGSSVHQADSRSFPTDWFTTVDCSPPRLMAAQLSLVSGRRADAWRGLAPLWMGALRGAPVGLQAGRAVRRANRKRTTEPLSVVV